MPASYTPDLVSELMTLYLRQRDEAAELSRRVVELEAELSAAERLETQCIHGMHEIDYPAGFEQSPWGGNVKMRVEQWGDAWDYETPSIEYDVDVVGADIVTSAVKSGCAGAPRHRPVLDIDIPAALVPSTTPGHSHLYLDVELSEGDYFLLLRQLQRAGIIQPGFANLSQDKGYSAVRLPWIKKEIPNE